MDANKTDRNMKPKLLEEIRAQFRKNKQTTGALELKERFDSGRAQLAALEELRIGALSRQVRQSSLRTQIPLQGVQRLDPSTAKKVETVLSSESQSKLRGRRPSWGFWDKLKLTFLK